MKAISMRCIGTLLGVLALSGAARAANVEDIVRDTQRLSFEDGQLSMVWWIPFEFWEESIKTNAALPEAARNQILGVMSEYNVVGLLRARGREKGLEAIEPKEELLKNTRVEFGGKVVEPLPAEKISPAALVLLAQLKPVIAQAAGQVGEAMEFVVYPGEVDGKQLIDALKPGMLTITFHGKAQHWRLPLGSLLPLKTDKSTGEQFPGSYDFNPFTGKKLEDNKPDDKKPASK